MAKNQASLPMDVVGEINVRLVGGELQQGRRGIHADVARHAGGVHIPFAGDVLGLLAIFISHNGLG
jgi:hypothetical protein